MQPIEFLLKIDSDCGKQIERAIALLWFVGRVDPSLGMTAKDVAACLESAGHPQQNTSRLDGGLRLDKRTAVARGGGWVLKPAARRVLDETYSRYLGPRPMPASDSIVPMDMLRNTRGYIERVGDQINKSFDGGLYDCCAVMCRRLLETLVVEMYEREGRLAEIRRDGQFFGFADLVVHLDKDKTLVLSKLGMKALKDFKHLGDLSAHNRRYNAHASDIEKVSSGMRLVAQEMLHMAGLYSPDANAAAA